MGTTWIASLIPQTQGSIQHGSFECGRSSFVFWRWQCIGPEVTFTAVPFPFFILFFVSFFFFPSLQNPSHLSSLTLKLIAFYVNLTCWPMTCKACAAVLKIEMMHIQIKTMERAKCFYLSLLYTPWFRGSMVQPNLKLSFSVTVQ